MKAFKWSIRCVPFKFVLMGYLFFNFPVSRSQHLNQQITSENSVNCEGTRDTRMVEHFFNLIFQEFYGIPPLCTCVQMCAEQPIYCYPNGCMKTKTKEPYQTLIQKEDQRVSLVIKDQNLTFSSNLFESPQNVNTNLPESTVELLPNILKDRLFNLRKTSTILIANKNMFIKSIILLTICAIMKLSRSQHLNQQITSENSVNCEGTRDTRMVEHFFNLIFQEFYGIPPLCTCVQMCAEQPIYCYPNGCMKTKTKEPYQTLIQKEDQRVSLVIKDQNLTFSSNLFESPQNVNTNLPESTVELLPNILKDRYKTLIKYKRTPNVELKHNLQQQVNTRKPPKSTIGNSYVSGARWPNRHKIQRKKKAVGTNEAKLITPVGNAPSIYTPAIVKKTTFKQENKLSIDNSTLKDIQLPSVKE